MPAGTETSVKRGQPRPPSQPLSGGSSPGDGGRSQSQSPHSRGSKAPASSPDSDPDSDSVCVAVAASLSLSLSAACGEAHPRLEPPSTNAQIGDQASLEGPRHERCTARPPATAGTPARVLALRRIAGA